MLALALLVSSLAAGAPGPAATQAADEARILAELQAVAPGAVEAARRASEAYLAQRWQEALEGYGQVLAAAPGFDHALRRQCRCRAQLGDRAGALPLCRAALEARASSWNEIALAMALATRTPDHPPADAELAQAAALASSAMRADPGDASMAVQGCAIALQASRWDLLRTCSATLSRLAPGDGATEYFATLAAALDERWSDARAHLAAARRAGLSEEAQRDLARILDANQPAWSRWGPLLLRALLAWAVGMTALLATGALLSATTLRGAARLVGERGPGGAGGRALRRLYAAVLGLTCAAYYLSLPLVVLVVLAAGYGLWMAVMAAGRIPIKLVLIVGLMVLVSLWSVAKSLWAALARRQGEDPGQRLDLREHPRFAAALEEAAARVGTRPVDAVFVTPGTDAAVYERGGLLQRLAGRSERCLILGIGLLDGMAQGELKAVLAHEYGHFVNRDTAGGGLALSVRRSVLEMGKALAQGGAATWYNPAWLFVNAFHRIFLRVSQGASRLQEILADRWAALAYGGASFAAGLRHVVARSVRFDRHAGLTLREVVEGGRGLRNLYRYAPAQAPDEAEIAAEIDQGMNAQPSPYDSHPRPADRVAWAGPVASDHPPAPADLEPAWALFEDREALERRLTAEVRVLVGARHAVHIPEVDPAPAAAEQGEPVA